MRKIRGCPASSPRRPTLNVLFIAGYSILLNSADMWAAYVGREIGGFLHVQKVDRFKAFTELLAEQVGQLVNLNELANTLQISRDTAGVTYPT